MRTYKRVTNEIKVTVWNDSGADWMIQDSGRTIAYSQKSFTMKGAIKFHGEMYGIK